MRVNEYNDNSVCVDLHVTYMDHVNVINSPHKV